MIKTKVKVQRDYKTPAKGLFSVILVALSFVFLCEIAIVIIRLLVGVS